MPLDNGTYEIYNVSVDKYFDLKDASVKPDNNVIGYHRDETRAQKWVVMRVVGDIYTMQSILSTKAKVATRGHVIESDVVIRPHGEQFEIFEEEIGLYRIKVPGDDLYFRLDEGADWTPVRLFPIGLGNDIWRFDKIQMK
ncbi:hypothetical protein V8E55_010480 [Tylopilus felleus]|jgi:hypothetical protein